jgi:hypothetical protein
MEIDPAAMMVSMLAARTQGLANIAIIKKQHEMDMQLIEMLSAVAKSAPPPGQGLKVDKSA